MFHREAPFILPLRCPLPLPLPFLSLVRLFLPAAIAIEIVIATAFCDQQHQNASHMVYYSRWYG